MNTINNISTQVLTAAAAGYEYGYEGETSWLGHVLVNS